MAELPERSREYVTPVCDSSRWDGYRPRPGDIVVCTPPKSGTTWTQMICAMLVHRSAELPLPLTRLSRWLDRYTIPVAELLRELEAQTHPRIIKTHTPLDGLPYYPEVQYVSCGRDPRDAFLSFVDHLGNISAETMADLNRRMGNPDDAQPPLDADWLFPLWVTTGVQPWTRDGAPFGLPTFHMVESFWGFRHLPNIYFLHYAALTRDLDGEMRRLAAWLGYAFADAEWPSLVAAASFGGMKRRAQETAPDADRGEWRSAGDFFRSARMEAWREGLSAENQALYETASSDRLDPDAKAWAEGGRLAGAC
jgi:hypothetical protein